MKPRYIIARLHHANREQRKLLFSLGTNLLTRIPGAVGYYGSSRSCIPAWEPMPMQVCSLRWRWGMLRLS